MYKRTLAAGILLTVCYGAAAVFGVYVFAGLLADIAQMPPLSPYDDCGSIINGIALRSGYAAAVTLVISFVVVILLPFLLASMALIKRGGMDAKEYKNSLGKTIAFVIFQGITAFCLADFALLGIRSLLGRLDPPLFGTLGYFFASFAVPSVIIATGVALIILDLIKNSKDLQRIG
ncbi:MAG: hypothetical protein LBP62_01730 [Clostridiales bacterium]|jgi:hypothetical protein|nr:hypothetical protein [Clostridiales bacterium]